MALTKCPDCGRDVSTQAAACPGCGHPISAAGAQRVQTSEDNVLTRNRGCADILIFGPILLFVLVIASRSC